jgi:hypothetical protein
MTKVQICSTLTYYEVGTLSFKPTTWPPDLPNLVKPLLILGSLNLLLQIGGDHYLCQHVPSEIGISNKIQLFSETTSERNRFCKCNFFFQNMHISQSLVQMMSILSFVMSFSTFNRYSGSKSMFLSYWNNRTYKKSITVMISVDLQRTEASKLMKLSMQKLDYD